MTKARELVLTIGGGLLVLALIGLMGSARGERGRRGLVGTGLSTGGGTMTGYLHMGGGNRITLDDDQDTWVYTTSDDVMRWYTGNNQRLVLTNTATTSYSTLDIANADDFIYSSAGSLQLGSDVTPGHSLGVGDVSVGGAMEVDGQAHFDAITNHYATLSFGAAAAHGSIVQGADDGLRINMGSNSNGNGNLIITRNLNVNKDHDHETFNTDPHLFVHSQTDPDSDNTQWLSFAHDQTNAVVTAGAGSVAIVAPGAMVLPKIENTGPAEPVACGATTTGTTVYVDDTDDGGAAFICVCSAITNDSTYDWVRIDNFAIPCNFF